ncbi:MAG: hypothetical protein DLM58_08965 [Pseudonocardiales bacterium]|nr:MAG: hypothetical protein DLM58_08965 [Pseudonocardiales bacterium]
MAEQLVERGFGVGGSERHPSWLELFFDLVFVAAVAALGTQLHGDHSLPGLVVFAGLFVPVWWAWRGFAWYASGFDTDDRTFRAALLAGMVGVAALSAGVHGAARGDSAQFVIAYASLLLILAALYAGVCWRRPAARALAAWQVLGYGVGAALWLVSLGLDESVRPVLWAMAMLVLMVAPLIVLWQPARAFDAGHIAERYGLFTIIVLGEAVVRTIEGLHIHGSTAAAAVALCGFVIAATMWWVYFARYRSMPSGGPVSRFGWAQVHLLIFVGIVAAGVGVQLGIEAAAAARTMLLVDRLPLGVGVAGYLIGMGTIRALTRRLDQVAVVRLVSAGAVLLIALAGFGLVPLAFVAVIAGLLLVEALIELTRAPAHPGEASA